MGAHSFIQFLPIGKYWAGFCTCPLSLMRTLLWGERKWNSKIHVLIAWIQVVLCIVCSVWGWTKDRRICSEAVHLLLSPTSAITTNLYYRRLRKDNQYIIGFSKKGEPVPFFEKQELVPIIDATPPLWNTHSEGDNFLCCHKLWEYLVFPVFIYWSLCSCMVARILSFLCGFARDFGCPSSIA